MVVTGMLLWVQLHFNKCIQSVIFNYV